MTEQSQFAVPTGQLFSIDQIKPNYTFELHNSAGEVGKLDFNGPELRFTGDADASAKIFIDCVAMWFAERLKQERDQALEDAAKFCESQQVNHSPRGGTRMFRPFNSECMGTHEGIYYAKAIRELK